MSISRFEDDGSECFVDSLDSSLSIIWYAVIIKYVYLINNIVNKEISGRTITVPLGEDFGAAYWSADPDDSIYLSGRGIYCILLFIIIIYQLEKKAFYLLFVSYLIFDHGNILVISSFPSHLLLLQIKVPLIARQMEALKFNQVNAFK